MLNSLLIAIWNRKNPAVCPLGITCCWLSPTPHHSQGLIYQLWILPLFSGAFRDSRVHSYSKNNHYETKQFRSMWNTGLWDSRGWKRKGIPEVVLLSSLLSPEIGVERALHEGRRGWKPLSTNITSVSLSALRSHLSPTPHPSIAPLRKPDIRPQSTQNLTEKAIYTSLVLKFLPNPQLSAEYCGAENFTQMLLTCQTFWCKMCPMILEPPLFIKAFCAVMDLSQRG